MLKLILESGYIDNELLEQLNEEQKQMLFQKMREQQIRKWSVREEEILRKERSAPPKPATKPKVGFLEGTDGRPWVWVMGEHPNDLPYEELVRRREEEREEKEKERVRKEAEELAKHETQDLLGLAEGANPEGGAIARSESYIIDFIETESPELKPRVVKPVKQLWQKAVESRTSLIQKMTEDERKAYEKRRADELYEDMLKSKDVAKNRAADVVLEIMEHWKKTEEKAKALEMERKQSIRKAKEIVKTKGLDEDSLLGNIPEEKKKELTRRISDRSLRKTFSQQVESVTTRVMSRYASFVSKGTKPKTIQHAIDWFRETESPKGVGREPDGSISLWFHGCINRATAESILHPKPAGMYLVRLSHKVWGYAISVKTHTSVKHYVVDASVPHIYKFIGKHQPEFPSLTNLLYYYRVNPITWRQEVLLLACEQPDEHLSSTKSIFQDQHEYDREETTF